MTWAKKTSTTTPHNHAVVFGRKLEGCPRCDELKAGAAPVKGWGAAAREREAQFIKDLKAHDCKKSGCGPVCTFGEW